jgi:hypothetical protein
MARGKRAGDTTTLQMALVGYQIEKEKIEEKIRELSSLLKGKRIAPPPSAENKIPGVKRELSAAARKRISIAQRKRWAEHRKRMAQTKQE